MILKRLMKRTYLFLIAIFLNYSMYAQPADGAIAPDFTFTDINGTSQNLYTYLDQGKYVIIDASTTWCVPCWNYHNDKVIDSLYEKHDMPGDTTWKVLFIEVDASTNNADLHGTGGNTTGDWVTGSNYTIIDPNGGSALSNFLTGYNVNFYPTLMIICPNKKIIQQRLNTLTRPSVKDWEDAALTCSTAGLPAINPVNLFSLYPNPAQDELTIHINNVITPADLVVTNTIGQVIATKHIQQSGSNSSITYDLSGLAKGVYFFCLTVNDNRQVKKVVVE